MKVAIAGRVAGKMFFCVLTSPRDLNGDRKTKRFSGRGLKK
ncbi:hypothetical protein [Candidatus Endomicrobiellum agilis]